MALYRSRRVPPTPPAVTLEQIIRKTDDAGTESLKPLGFHDDLAPIRSVVLHLQSPNCKSTFISLPPLNESIELGIVLPFLHLQLKPLGHHFMFELALRDEAGIELRLRCSTFQVASPLSHLDSHKASFTYHPSLSSRPSHEFIQPLPITQHSFTYLLLFQAQPFIPTLAG